MAVLLAAAALGIGVVEKSVFVLAPNLIGEAACADGGVVYIITTDPGTAVQARDLNGTLVGSVAVRAVDCAASGGRLYLLADRCLYVFDRNLRELARVELEGRVVTLPRGPVGVRSRVMALRGDRLYVVLRGREGPLLEVRDAGTLRLLDAYRLPSGDECEWGLAEGDDVVAYGVCLDRAGSRYLKVVWPAENRTDVLGLDVPLHSKLLSLGGRLYLAYGSTLVMLGGNASRHFSGEITDVKTDGRYLYVLYWAYPPRLARLSPDLSAATEVAVTGGASLELAISGDMLYLVKYGQPQPRLPKWTVEVGIDAIRPGNYTPGAIVFCYAPSPLDVIWLGTGGIPMGDCCCVPCCVSVQGVIPGWHRLEVLSRDLALLTAYEELTKLGHVTPSRLKEIYAVYVEPGKTAYVIRADPVVTCLAALALLAAAFLLIKRRLRGSRAS